MGDGSLSQKTSDRTDLAVLMWLIIEELDVVPILSALFAVILVKIRSI